PGPAGAVGSVELLGDNPLQRDATGRFEHRLARGLDMLQVAEVRGGLGGLRIQHLFETVLALYQRRSAQILAVHEEKIEDEEHQRITSTVRQRGLEGREVGRALRIQRDRFTVNDTV